jgi:DNA-binding transcriptional regulator PaaX
MTIESRLLELITRQLEQSIMKADLVQMRYDDRFKIPTDFIEKAWGLVDQDALLKKMSERLESELIDRLVNALAAEIATDIKQVLSVKERREAVRHVVRQNIDLLTKGE